MIPTGFACGGGGGLEWPGAHPAQHAISPFCKTQEGNMNDMRLGRYSFAAWSCLLALLGTPPANVGGTTQQEAEQKASPEMDRLKKLYLGSWDYTETYAKTPFYPQGGSDSGVYTSEPGPGGNSIVNRFHSHGAVGDFEGLLVITWDPKEKAYKSYVFGNGFPGCVVQTGQFEGDALVFRSDFAAQGVKMQLRNVTRVSAAGKIVSEEYITTEGSPEVLMMRVDAKKRP
jgi:hypothetical protein